MIWLLTLINFISEGAHPPWTILRCYYPACHPFLASGRMSDLIVACSPPGYSLWELTFVIRNSMLLFYNNMLWKSYAEAQGFSADTWTKMLRMGTAVRSVGWRVTPRFSALPGVAWKLLDLHNFLSVTLGADMTGRPTWDARNSYNRFSYRCLGD